MNTFIPYVVGTSCILKGGDRADHRMTELNELIASAKGYQPGKRQIRAPWIFAVRSRSLTVVTAIGSGTAAAPAKKQ